MALTRTSRSNTFSKPGLARAASSQCRLRGNLFPDLCRMPPYEIIARKRFTERFPYPDAAKALKKVHTLLRQGFGLDIKDLATDAAVTVEELSALASR